MQLPAESERLPEPGLDARALGELRELLLRSETGRGFGWPLVVVTGLFFLVWASGSNGVVGAIGLLAVVLVHELGHLVAMRALGYTDTSIYFVPFLGGLATGRSREPKAWKEGLVLLAGPVPGLLVGVGVLVVLSVTGSRIQAALELGLGALVVINALNLLPVMPLDGGRLMAIALFSGKPMLELVFAVATGGLLAVLAVAGGEWFVAAFAGLFVYGTYTARHHALVAHRLRERLGPFPSSARDLSEEHLAHLYLAGAALSGPARPAPGEPWARAGTLVAHAGRVHRRAAVPVAAPVTRVLLLVAYALAWAPALVLIALVVAARALGA